jgi:hypothetical protein
MEDETRPDQRWRRRGGEEGDEESGMDYSGRAGLAVSSGVQTAEGGRQAGRYAVCEAV